MPRDCVSTACEPCRLRRSKCDSARPSCGSCMRLFTNKSDQHCSYNLDNDMRTKGALRKVIREQKDKIELRDRVIANLVAGGWTPCMGQGKTLTQDDVLREILGHIAQPKNTPAYGMGFPRVKGPPTPLSNFDMCKQLNVTGFGSMAVAQFSTGLEMNLPPGSPFSPPVSSIASIGVQNLKLDPGTPFSTSGSVYGHVNGPAASLPDQGLSFGWSTEVTHDQNLIMELLRLYFRWVYPCYAVFVKRAFCNDNNQLTDTKFCTPFLLNAILAAGCNYFPRPDKATLGMQFFNEARKQYKLETQLSLPQTQALGVLSIYSLMNGELLRGWKYQSLMMSGILDLNLHIPYEATHSEQVDFRNISKQTHEVTMWGCYNLHMGWCEILGRPLTLSRSIIQTPLPMPIHQTEYACWEDSELPSHQYTIVGALACLSLVTKGSVNYLKLRNSGIQVPENIMEEQYQAILRWFGSISPLLKTFATGQPPLPQILTLHVYYYTSIIRLMYPSLSCASPGVALDRCTQAAKNIFELTHAYQAYWCCSFNSTSDPNNAYTIHLAYSVFLAAKVCISNLAMHYSSPEAAIHFNFLIRTLFAMQENLPLAKQFLSKLKANIIKQNYPTRGWQVLDDAVNQLLSLHQQSSRGHQQTHQPAPQQGFIQSTLQDDWVLSNDCGREGIDANLAGNGEVYHQNFSNNANQNPMDALPNMHAFNPQLFSNHQSGEPSGSDTQQQATILAAEFDDDSMSAKNKAYGSIDPSLDKFDFEDIFGQQERLNNGEEGQQEGGFMF